MSYYWLVCFQVSQAALKQYCFQPAVVCLQYRNAFSWRMSVPNNMLARLGNTGLYVLADLGRMALFTINAFRSAFRTPFRFREFLKQLNFIGAGSLLVIFFTAISTGMVLGLQGYYSLHKFGAEGMLGSAVSLTLILELGPVLTALMVTGRAGSAMCAEIGIMRISEQIDALECMGGRSLPLFYHPEISRRSCFHTAADGNF